MNERLLQYIWQFSFYNSANLETCCGRRVQVIRPGTWNHDQGPDFLEARISIDGQVWIGSVEIHIRSSDWFRHGHEKDPKYNNVILHVVWQHDAGTSLPFPSLELQHRIPRMMLERYTSLMTSTQKLPCHHLLHMPGEITLLAWKERLVAERLEARSGRVKELLENTNYHWEEVFWRLIARSFGNGVNSDAFEQVATWIPLKILVKHRHQLVQVEALLLGQAGLLDREFTDKYPRMLRREYQFLSKKYGLPKHHYPLNYLRMRPANFPAVRLAQLAALICKSHSLFAHIREARNLCEVKEMFAVQANDYWSYHYRPDEESAFKIKHAGAQLIHNIISNTVAVMLHAYGRQHDEALSRKAIEWLGLMPPEKNRITSIYEGTSLHNATAFDSQALMHLKQFYCDQKRCLECAVGNALLRAPVVGG